MRPSSARAKRSPVGGRWRRRAASLLHGLADALAAEREELARLEARNAGKPIGDARWEANHVADTLRYYAGAADKFFGETIAVKKGGLDITLHDPLGVVGLIVPWNFPMVIATWKLAPALACGNTVVLKPASLTPLTALRLGELALEAGLPPGVLNVVPGPGASIGAALAAHPDVAKISFTGETATGRESCARRRQHQTRRPRARWQVAEHHFRRRRHRAGRRRGGRVGIRQCRPGLLRALTRHRRAPIYDRFVEAMAAAAEALRRRRPARRGHADGTVDFRAHREKVSSFVNGDAPVAIRGQAPDGPGFWFAPTVLCPVDPASRLAREEIFGPVATVIPFDDEDEAVRLANDTVYGLSGSIWTRDGARALRVARAIDTGVLAINSNTSVRVAAPFGGLQAVGLGRELGPHALDAYTEVKSIYYATS